MRTETLIKTRRIVVFALLAILTVELISGLILFLPELGFDIGDIFYETISRHDWKTIHELLSYLLIPTATLHLALNWKIIKQYPKTILKKPFRKIVGLLLISIGVFSAFTGLLLRFYFVGVGEGGGRGFGRGGGVGETLSSTVTFFGLTRDDTVFWHEYVSLGIIILIAIHIILNRKIISFYIFGPKKSAKQAKTKIPYFDLMKIKHILLIHYTGVPIFYTSFDSNKLNPELLSGLVSALTMAAKEILQTRGHNVYTVHDYEDLKVFLVHGNYLMLGLISSGQLSTKLLKTLHRGLTQVEEKYAKDLANWPGDPERGTLIMKELAEQTNLFIMHSKITNIPETRKLKCLKEKIETLKNKYSELTIATVVNNLTYKEMLTFDKALSKGEISLEPINLANALLKDKLTN